MPRNGAVAVLAASCAVACVALPAAAPAVAATQGAGPAAVAPALSSRAATYPPFLVSTGSTIRQLVAVGSTMYAVGTFSRVGTPDGRTYVRHNLFAFNTVTGAVTSWAPRTNGAVYAATPSADGRSLFVGGDFTTVNGRGYLYLAKLSTSTGRLVRTFRAHADHGVRALRMHRGHLLVGGVFTSIGGARKTALASLRPSGGRADGYVRGLTLRGVAPGLSPGVTRVIRLVRDHARDKMLALGSFTSVSGHARRQVFMVDLGRRGASLDRWSPPQFRLSCAANLAQYVRAAAWGPSDQRVAFATTGHRGASPLCDAVSLYRASPTARAPLWVNRTGCDSLYSVAVTKDSVYVGGHQRWLDNRTGCDFAGAGAVSRPGIGAVSQATGRATSWNPTRDRGVGADDMVLTRAGLWVASDNLHGSTQCAGAFHPGLCFFRRS